MSEYWKIGQLATMFDLSHDTLRLYDRMGLLKPDKNPHTGYRSYTYRHLERLELILLGKGLGIPLKDLKETFENASIETIRNRILEQQTTIATQITRLQQLEKTSQKIVDNLEWMMILENKLPEIETQELDLLLYPFDPQIYGQFIKELKPVTLWFTMNPLTHEEHTYFHVEEDIRNQLKPLKLSGSFSCLPFIGNTEELDAQLLQIKEKHAPDTLYLAEYFANPKNDGSYYIEIFWK
ncbi:MerR family transcriptional regulator [Streptococcus suis]|uniref:MerR family transcriptional regulator n=1 Tax=Streptococcus suis TaxID=1307 RepID=UPI0037D4ECC4